jgi:lipid II:glycine glycyltransferase (peptidoglycan interpeptide bridge formation enzyme)
LKPIAQRNEIVDNGLGEMRAPLLRALPRLPEDFARPQDSSYQPLEARIVNPMREPEWDEWIDSHPENTIFHSAAWARVLVETYNHQPCYLRVCARGELIALIPMIEVQSLITRCRGVCLPFSDYCSPLLFNSFSKLPVMEKVRQVARERSWNYFEVRGNSIVPEDAQPSETYYGHRLDLRAGSTELFSCFASSVQRAIRKAERSGLTVDVHSTGDAMDDFYLLHARTRRRHGAPPQPRAFFASIQRNIINAGLGFIVLVKSGKRVVAAAMFFKRGSKAIYKFGASDERVQALRPNNLAMWKAIELLSDSGVKTLHFGRTEKDNEGLRRFKCSWGATEEAINYFKFDTFSNSWITPAKRNLRFHREIFRALPVTINRFAGAMIYPHLD